MTKVIVDTGPLLETLVPGARHHRWVCEQWKRFKPPLLTCEAVVSEAVFLLQREQCDAGLILDMIDRGFLKIAISLTPEANAIRALMKKYRNQPMSLADACLVRLSELHNDSVLFTLDSDFQVYRRHGNLRIPALMPGC